jgi:tRNA pseudouridine-54 N-methylase
MIGFAHKQDQEQKTQNTIHVSRLKLLFLVTKIVSGHAKYFLHEKGRIENMTVLTQNSGIK